MSVPQQPSHWWQTGIIYQVYPRSFCDAIGQDGVGDLPGITAKLDYLQWLGVDAIWISPFYPSPQDDFGYDVSNYTDVDARFGTLRDFDALLTAAHAHGIKVILDFVPSHTSHTHPWFQEAKRSRDNPYRDWYIWADPQPGGARPNNWRSMFGGSAWEWDASTQQYYLHTFLPQQPDVNWRNPALAQAMHDIMHFWLRRGVDGFRIDVIYALIKDTRLRDDPHGGARRRFSLNRPEAHDVLRGMRRVVNAYPDRVLIGEPFLETHKGRPAAIRDLVRYYGADDECHLPFNWGLIRVPWVAGGVQPFAWNPQAIRRYIETYEATLPPGAWPNWVLGNHDQPRVASKVPADQARVAQMLLLTLRGTPTCYYGDEIGMVNAEIPPDHMVDQFGQRVEGQGRDRQRSPMHWDSSVHAGFCAPEVTPWLPIAQGDAAVRNVERQRHDPASMLTYVRALIQLRRATVALRTGEYATVQTAYADVLAYRRRHQDQQVVVVLNFGAHERVIDVQQLGIHDMQQLGIHTTGHVLLSTDVQRAPGAIIRGVLRLQPNEGVIFLILP